MLRNSIIRSGAQAPRVRLLALAVAAGLVTPAVAQQDGVEEVIVTAEFRETNLQDTPIAITAVNAAMLDARSQTNIVDVAAQAPNVTLKPGGQANGPSMVAFIRGIGQTDFNFAVEPGVGVYVDDIYYPTLTGSMVELLDLDRVEILRGPQGTLAGRNSIGGAIKLYSRKPSGGDGGGTLAVTYGDYDRVDVSGNADFTLVDDKLFARVSGVSRTRDGYVKRLDYECAHPGTSVPTFIAGGDLNGCVVGKEGGVSFTGGRVVLEWDPSDTVTVNIIGDMIDDDSEANANTLIRVNEARNNPNLGQAFGISGNPIGYNGADYDGDAVNDGTFFDADGDFTTTGDRVYYSNAFVTSGPFAADPAVREEYVNYSTYLDPNRALPNRPFSPMMVPPVSTLNQRGLSFDVNWDINDMLSFRSITAMREYDSDWAQDVDASPFNSQMLLQRLEHDHFTQEFRLNGIAFDDRLDYTLGAFYVDQDGTLEANVNLYYAQLNFIHGPDPTPSQAQALFGHAVWNFDETKSLSVGIRASEDEKTYIYKRRNPDGTLPVACPDPATATSVTAPPNCVLASLFNVSGTFEDSRTDWRVAFDWRFTDDVMVYTQAATGFKGGGINPRPFFLVQIESFQPEELTSWEFGAKSTLADGRVRLNGALFFNEYTDIQINQTQCEVPFPPFFGAPCLQPGNVGDADVSGFEVEAEASFGNWLFDFSGSVLDFEYTRLASNVATTLDMITAFTPELEWSAGAQYEINLPGGGTLTPRLDFAYQDEIYTYAVNNPANLIDDYTLANARLTWRAASDDWEASLELTNLSEEFYFLNIFEQYDSSGTVSGTPGLPRMWAITLRRNF